MRQVKRRKGQVCALKADISKYFPSIDHTILRQLLRKRIACRDTLALLDGIIASTANPDDPHPRGIPIGNLTSQLFANIYLHALDEFVKYELREHYYLRYMDDFVVVHHDKEHLHQLRRTIEAFLWERLRLRTNHKTQVFPVRPVAGRPLDFLGYRIWPTHRKLRKDSVRRMRERMKRMEMNYSASKMSLSQIAQRIHSWLGHAKHACTYRLRCRVLAGAVFERRSRDV